MHSLKVCFVGIGSIARRHIRNLNAVCCDRGISLHIDAYRSVLREPVSGIKKIYTDIDNMPNDYDVIFITNPTELHLETLYKFHHKGKHFFIEKPVISISQIDEAKLLVPRKDTVYYVACPLRYNAVIQYLKGHIDPKKVISVRSISSSYLPDWRPGQDYRETYSAHKDMGGGVSIDLIHEWDYLTYLFGMPTDVKCFIGKKSRLETDSDDYAIYIADYRDKAVELHLDYFGRKTIREVQIFTEDETILGDIVNNRIDFLKSGNTIDFHEKRDDFQRRELEHFLDIIDRRVSNDSDYFHGILTLGLTQGRASNEYN